VVPLGFDLPHPAGSHQHFTAILRVQNVWSIEGSLIAAQIVGPDDLENPLSLQAVPNSHFKNRDVGIRRKPLIRIRRFE